MSGLFALAAAMIAAPTPASLPAPIEVTAPGPEGALAGTLLDPDARAPLVLIIPGSGPTDRDGNNPMGVAGGPYRQLAEALAVQGVASVRVDKRGMFGSKAALADANNATTAGYADDVHAWIATIRQRTGRKCVWVLGHSEGALVALQAAQAPAGMCGVILLSGGGRPIGAVLRDQLRANPANAPILDAALAAVDALEAGHRVPEATLPAPIQPLFADRLQSYWIDLLSHDPAKLIAAVKLPVLIVQGERDLQVSVKDAQLLKAAQPSATLLLVPGVNHVLRQVASDDRAANMATYRDATLAIDPAVPAAVAGFVKR
ncbi:MAG: alpha/beta fold hydrolase [Pseudomonadota bacterium]